MYQLKINITRIVIQTDAYRMNHHQIQSFPTLYVFHHWALLFMI